MVFAMKNEPVAWTDGKGNYFDKNSFFPVDDLIPLYTHQYERPHNTVLVPCDKLAEMQAEIAALKVKAHEWYLIAMEKAQE